MAMFTASASKTDHMVPFTNMYKDVPFAFSSTQVTMGYCKIMLNVRTRNIFEIYSASTLTNKFNKYKS